MIESVSFDLVTYNKPPFKYEAGTPPIANVIGMGAAIDFISSIDESLYEKKNNLINFFVKKLKSINGVKVVGNPERRGCIVSFNIKGIHPHDFSTVADHNNVCKNNFIFIIKLEIHKALWIMENKNPN